jgi:translation elongation factor EF-G
MMPCCCRSKKQEIPQKTEAFVDAMEKIFGQGADYLEILIMKRLHTKIGLEIKLSSPNLTFTEYVEAAKKRYSQDTSGERQEIRRCRQVRVKC